MRCDRSPAQLRVCVWPAATQPYVRGAASPQQGGTREGCGEAIGAGNASSGRNPAAETQAAGTSAGECLLAAVRVSSSFASCSRVVALHNKVDAFSVQAQERALLAPAFQLKAAGLIGNSAQLKRDPSGLCMSAKTCGPCCFVNLLTGTHRVRLRMVPGVYLRLSMHLVQEAFLVSTRIQ